MFYYILVLFLIYSEIPTQAQPVSDDYYQSAIVFFNYTDKRFRIILGSLDHDTGYYGSHSPKRNITGPIVIPSNDINGCEEAVYHNTGNHTSWIALVARGQCTFYTKIKKASVYNASAVIVYDQEGATNPVVMNTEGADDIVSVSVLYELGDTVSNLVAADVHVTGSIVAGKIHSSPSSHIPLERGSIIFVAAAFMILMIVSLAWLVFYYIQKFRMIRDQHRVSHRQREMFLRALGLMPKRHLKSSDELIGGENMCAICLELYKSSDVVRTLPCKHEFHKRCVDPWLEAKQTCPMCKINVMKSLGLLDHDNPALVQDEESQRSGGVPPVTAQESNPPFADQTEPISPYTDIPDNAYTDGVAPPVVETEAAKEGQPQNNLTV